MSRWVAGHRKMLAGAAGVLVTFAVQMGWSANPWVALAVGTAAVLGIYQFPNQPAPPPPGPSLVSGPHRPSAMPPRLPPEP